jgi:hypothetical protein
MWISKDEYDESGPAIVHRKCFWSPRVLRHYRLVLELCLVHSSRYALQICKLCFFPDMNTLRNMPLMCVVAPCASASTLSLFVHVTVCVCEISCCQTWLVGLDLLGLSVIAYKLYVFYCSKWRVILNFQFVFQLWKCYTLVIHGWSMNGSSMRSSTAHLWLILPEICKCYEGLNYRDVLFN